MARSTTGRKGAARSSPARKAAAGRKTAKAPAKKAQPKAGSVAESKRKPAARTAAPAGPPVRKTAAAAKPAAQPKAKTSTAASAKSASARQATATPARKMAPAAGRKSTAAKQPAARVSTKSGRAKAPATTARRLRTPAPVQRFTVSHLNEADFHRDGLRPYALYRELGIAAATGGLCQAHVIRFIPPCTEEVRQRHRHETELQLIYVLKGWIKNEFDGHGEQMMSAGSCWIQPPGIRHTVLDYSADCEVLEIIIPADFKTLPAE